MSGKNRTTPIARAKRAARAFAYRGNTYECPLCGGKFRSMLDSPKGRRDAFCPKCRCGERHRALWLYLERETDVTTGRYRVLHFAPELGISTKLRALPGLDYTTVDLYAPNVDVTADITDLPFDTASVDLILCNHVLEHVQDDATAIKELYRVLRPGGRAIMQHPVDMGRPTTLEDPTITTPEQRDRVFWQHDHVRIYGRDFVDRLRLGGFDVSDEGLYEDRLDPAERERFRVETLPSARPERDVEASRIFLCTVPADVS